MTALRLRVDVGLRSPLARRKTGPSQSSVFLRTEVREDNPNSGRFYKIVGLLYSRIIIRHDLGAWITPISKQILL